jgi:hypothetical protein
MEITEFDPMRHHSITYPMEVGAPKFELVPVQDHKDLMVNTARMYARQEYERIMQVVRVLQQQADSIKRRLDVTDWIYAAEYQFKIYHGRVYWLAHDHKKGITRLLLNSPTDWACGIPEHWEYICPVKSLGDSTWIELNPETLKPLDS